MAKESVIEKMKHKMQPPPPKEVSISEANRIHAESAGKTGQ